MATIELPISLQQAIEACSTLPSVPSVAFQVLQLSQDEDIDISKVVKVISNDPALIGNILKVANSPLHGLRSEVTTLDRAVSLLGTKTILSLALSFSLVHSIKKFAGTRGFDHQSYWRRSAVSATASRAVAANNKDINPDEVFLAGILQDIGMLVLNEVIPERYGPIVVSASGDHHVLVEIERSELETDHAQVGGWLLTRWNLPEKLRTAVALSHSPESTQRSDRFSRSVILGSEISEICFNPNTGSATAIAGGLANSLLQISQQRFDSLLGEIAAALPEAIKILNIDIGDQLFADRLLDQAREALAELNAKSETDKPIQYSDAV